MKLINTYSVGALATMISSAKACHPYCTDAPPTTTTSTTTTTTELPTTTTVRMSSQTLTGNDLIPVVDDENTGIIWNSDKSLCLTMSGNVFDDDLSGVPAASAKAHKKPKKKNTCEGGSASFTNECATLMAGGLREEDLPLEYRFRIAEHADLDNRFCIINACDDGLNPGGSVYKLQWNGPKKISKEPGKKHSFQLKDFGGNSTNVLDNYFQFDTENQLTFGSYSDGESHPVVWSGKNNNVWHVKAADKVDRYNLFGVPESCSEDN
jgi:hypothetical protein